MKKLALTSLLAVFAVSGAHAANVIDGNPLYRPGEGRFYSITSVESQSEHTNVWGLGEEFGYGITDRLAVELGTSVSEANWFDASSWNQFSLGLNYRALDYGNWKADVYGMYSLNPVWGDHVPFLDEDYTTYTWTVGLRAGYVADGWTVAGHFAYDYLNSESFNWGDDGVHKLRAGLDGLLSLTSDWALLAGVEYTGITNEEADDAGTWTGKLGLNYNIDETKFIGAYITGEMEHSTGDWEFVDGFGFGVTFGIDF